MQLIKSTINGLQLFLIINLILNIELIYALNKPPSLIRSIDLSTINENTPVNHQVFQLVAHDPENTPVSFEIDGTDLLKVDRRTGTVSVAKPIDREKTGDQIHFSVILQDQVPLNSPISSNGQSDEANIVNIPVKVSIVDDNDNAPVWHYIENNITINEDTEPGTPILKDLYANDADTVGSILRASCDGCGSLFHLQNIDSPSISLLRASLILTQHIEFRLRANQFNITLYVTDGVHNSSLRLFITIKDVQNRPPIFIGAREISLLENTPVGTMVYHVRAIDGDAINDEQMVSFNEKSVNLQFVNFGRKLAYFLDENPGEFFSLDQRSGELRIANQLDREASFLNNENNQTTLTVKLRVVEISDDNGQLDDQEISTARSELKIKILDCNDNKPIFGKDQYTVTIKENHQPGTILSPSLIISVQDRDMGLNSLFRVRLLETGSEYFELYPTEIDGSGQITVRLKKNYTLDYENVEHRRFNLLLEAKELKTKEKFSTTSHLLINLMDENDNSPKFIEQSYLANLIENAQPGTTIKSLQATDRDSPALTRLTYELRGDHSHLFDLDSKTGMLRVAHCQTPGVTPCLDFERRTYYNLTCTAYDGFGLNTSVQLRVQLLDANDNSPIVSRSIYEAEIEENADHFDKPVFVHATDADISSVLTYSLINENDLTAIDQLIPNSNLETSDEINEEPIAEDRIGLISSDDLESSASRFVDLIEVAPVTMTSIEGINDYHNNNNVKNSVEKQFAVDMKTGEIRVLRPVAYSEKPIILTVKVSDGLHGVKTKVKIVVRDTNDHEPVFSHNIYYTNISETAEIGQKVTQIRAHDADVGLNAQIIYTLLPNLDEPENSYASTRLNDDFVINNRTGVLFVNNALDYDRKNVYSYKLKAEDCGEPKRSSITTVIVNVLNENNKNPYFKPAIQNTEVKENAAVGSRIYKLIAEDPDLLVEQKQKKHTYRQFSNNYYLNNLNDGLNNNNNEDEGLLYRIENVHALSKDNQEVVQGSPAWHEVNKFFAIDSHGYLTIVNPLRYELAALITLNLSVFDTLAPGPQVGYGKLVIKIIDYNENAPVFNAPWSILNPHVEFTTNEEQPIGTVIGRLTATDIDTEIDYYKIDPPSKYFSINNQTGLIKVEKVLDYETIRDEDLRFNVFAFDTGVPQLSALCIVHVNLININDNKPVFNQSDYNVSIPENLEWGSFVLMVQATDLDKDNYGKIKYSIVSSQSNDEKTNQPVQQDIQQYFFINEDTGVIRVTQGANLDREAGLKEINFQVSAVDNPSNSNPLEEQGSRHHPVRTHNQINSNQFNDDLYSEESSEIHQTQTFAFANVRVKILDENDNKPIFVKQNYSFRIYDYSDINREYNYYANYFTSSRDELRQVITQVKATDADEGINSLIKYKILSGNLNGVFELDEINGKLYASKTPLKINRDVYSYKLEIEARDQNGKGKLSDKIQLSISIHRVNKYKPRFLFPLGSNAAHNTLSSINDNVVTTLENQPIGTRVCQIQAEDLDGTNNNGIIKFAFKINSNHTSQETELFKIDPQTGVITTKIIFDREQQSQYSLMLSASDYLAEPHPFETLQELIIKIGDLDDNLPEFEYNLLDAKKVLSKDESIDQNILSFLIDDNRPIEYTYLFKISENLPKSTVVGKIQAIDKDEKPENRKIFYHIIDGNEQGLFDLNLKTGLLQTNQPLDRESQSFYQLIVKASPNENYTVNELMPTSNIRNLTQRFKLERDRSFSADDHSLALIGIEISDLNDNEPVFEKELYRVAVSHQAKLNDTLVFVKAKDPDSEVNASLIYSIAHTDMYRKYIDDLENPVSPIPSPIGIDQNTGRLNVIQLMNQYPTQTRFVVNVEARERSSPFRIVRSIVHVYVYDPAKLIKITIRLRPSLVEQQRDNIEQLLSDNLEHPHLRALITSLKYHLDVRRGRVVHEFTDCFVLIVDERNLADIQPEKMISKLDSNAAKLIFANEATNYQDENGQQPQHYTIEQITLASSMMNTGTLQPLLYNFTSQLSNDTQTMVFFILVILIIIGFISMAVSCCCLRSWYYQKLIERAQLAQQKSLFNVGATLASTNGMPLGSKYAPSFLADQFGGDPNELYTQSVHSYPYGITNGCLNGSLNGLNDGSLRRPRSKNSTLRQQIPANGENGRINQENGSAAWLADGVNKYFEEQELSVQVATMDLTDDSVNYNNYSVKNNNNNKNRQRLPDRAGNAQEIVRKNNDYHELKNSTDGQSSDN